MPSRPCTLANLPTGWFLNVMERRWILIDMLKACAVPGMTPDDVPQWSMTYVGSTAASPDALFHITGVSITPPHFPNLNERIYAPFQIAFEAEDINTCPIIYHTVPIDSSTIPSIEVTLVKNPRGENTVEQRIGSRMSSLEARHLIRQAAAESRASMQDVITASPTIPSSVQASTCRQTGDTIIIEHKTQTPLPFRLVILPPANTRWWDCQDNWAQFRNREDVVIVGLTRRGDDAISDSTTINVGERLNPTATRRIHVARQTPEAQNHPEQTVGAMMSQSAQSTAITPPPLLLPSPAEKYQATGSTARQRARRGYIMRQERLEPFLGRLIDRYEDTVAARFCAIQSPRGLLLLIFEYFFQSIDLASKDTAALACSDRGTLLYLISRASPPPLSNEVQKRGEGSSYRVEAWP
ncbi:hypothetical protein SISSUDRAFT_1066506 [Sistotremastrum suecicum HHB10207 ss-3]|uniref:Uncharacterized protein n=1 Tax=Sistotremastrum suecicum HHB10207 ss-3 TaxID=1314776 RepID=A0A165Y8P6_9AGAM|nr:hypothetical protein SISSUDRAFT_1066506 [Sistotremastrum suecicum HHB10207 ss-3]